MSLVVLNIPMVVTYKAEVPPLTDPQIGETLEACNILVRGDANLNPKDSEYSQSKLSKSFELA